MLPIRGKQAVLFRLVAIPTAALIASHVVFYRKFPGEASYQFPWSTFLTIGLIMVSCWEANVWVFRWLDRRIPFHQNPLRRIGRQILYGGLITTLTFAIVFTLISSLAYQEIPSPKQYTLGLLICFAIASIINGIYVGFYLVDVIYWQEQQTAEQLNIRLAEQQRRVSTTEPATALPTAATAETPAMVRSGILIELGSQLQQLSPAEIAYFYSSGGIVQLIRTDGRKFTTSYDSLAELEHRLPKDQFFQINRQYIVNISAVRTVRDDINRKLDIALVPALVSGRETEHVTISRYRSAEFRKWLTTKG